MLFTAKREGSISRQIEALQVAGVINSGAPRLRRHMKPPTLADGSLARSYSCINFKKYT